MGRSGPASTDRCLSATGGNAGGWPAYHGRATQPIERVSKRHRAREADEVGTPLHPLAGKGGHGAIRTPSRNRNVGCHAIPPSPRSSRPCAERRRPCAGDNSRGHNDRYHCRSGRERSQTAAAAGMALGGHAQRHRATRRQHREQTVHMDRPGRRCRRGIGRLAGPHGLGAEADILRQPT